MDTDVNLLPDALASLVSLVAFSRRQTILGLVMDFDNVNAETEALAVEEHRRAEGFKSEIKTIIPVVLDAVAPPDRQRKHATARKDGPHESGW